MNKQIFRSRNKVKLNDENWEQVTATDMVVKRLNDKEVKTKLRLSKALAKKLDSKKSYTPPKWMEVVKPSLAYDLRKWVKTGVVNVDTLQGAKMKNTYGWRETNEG